MAQLMYKHVHEPPPTANLTPAQTAVFHRALAKQLADRFATVSGIHHRLARNDARGGGRA
ncbi:MAG: hypothetical protein M5U34_16730 [Chloroflexi bacterium]|nr:hypothetical protein [Chloroflexota bacterium]